MRHADDDDIYKPPVSTEYRVRNAPVISLQTFDSPITSPAVTPGSKSSAKPAVMISSATPPSSTKAAPASTWSMSTTSPHAAASLGSVTKHTPGKSISADSPSSSASGAADRRYISQHAGDGHALAAKPQSPLVRKVSSNFAELMSLLPRNVDVPPPIQEDSIDAIGKLSKAAMSPPSEGHSRSVHQHKPLAPLTTAHHDARHHEPSPAHTGSSSGKHVRAEGDRVFRSGLRGAGEVIGVDKKFQVFVEGDRSKP